MNSTLAKLGFYRMVCISSRNRQACFITAAIRAEIYIYGYLNRIQSAVV